MANHIRTLTNNLTAADARNAALSEEINALIAHLSSSKFSCGDPLDGYVSTGDVISRLRTAQRVATDAEMGAPVVPQ
jgi:hypothetical protein